MPSDGRGLPLAMSLTMEAVNEKISRLPSHACPSVASSTINFHKVSHKLPKNNFPVEKTTKYK